MTDRRTFLRGIAIAPIATLPAVLPALASTRAVAATTPASVTISDLWSSHLSALGEMTVASDAYSAASERLLPWWAAVGPSRVDHEGKFSGSAMGWPAMQDYSLPNAGVFRQIRVSETELRRLFEIEKGLFGEARAKDTLDRRTVALNERIAAQKDERVRLGLGDLSARCDAASDAVFDREELILNLPPITLNVLAAQIMIAIVRESDIDATAEDSAVVSIAVIALRGLLPSLTGEIARDAAEFVNHPDRRVDQMRASKGLTS